MSFLEVTGLVKRFGQVDVLKDVNVELEEGGFLVLVGPSGCGKTTLLNVIAGLIDADEGELRIAGRRVNELPPSKRDIAMVFQSYALYPNMTVRQNIAFGLEMRGVPKPERDSAVGDAAETLQISHLLDRKPSALSGGQRQRVAMGRALVRNPLVFLFDEPLSNLDAKLRVEMRTEIKRLHHRTGVTMVYVTHDQVEAMTLATKIAVMERGVIQQIGTPADIYERPANLFVAQFMGSPSMNLFDCEVVISNGDKVLQLTGAPSGVRVGVKNSPDADKLQSGDKLLLGIRPEAIVHRQTRAQGGQSITSFEVQVDVVEPTGPDMYVLFRVGGREITARVGAGSRVAEGEVSTFGLDAERAVIFEPRTEKALQLQAVSVIKRSEVA
jgi:multiple sugar transport system ATP-binding protein